MKVRSIYHFSELMDNEFSWRIKEISIFKRLVLSGHEEHRKCLRRAAIPIIYCHWEGFVKTVADHYGSFVSDQVAKMSDLKSCFMGPMLKAKFDDIVGSKRSFKLWHEGSELVKKLADEKPKISLFGRLSHVGNLNYDVFSEIAYVCGLDMTYYETKKNFIDEIIVAKRNKVAHGEFLQSDEAEIVEAIDLVIEIMRTLKTDLENGAVLKSYLN
ncbi:MAE_28990/MAE_18760 family HEPN-like nuclease [Mesorhizobium sp. M0293]|uniref:MAE_28990/MAE_18760 family HEPN-like nuclease n=1 Tax=unclassified Mesorhizobium TaxID=325217 RepID=UPI00333740F3